MKSILLISVFALFAFSFLGSLTPDSVQTSARKDSIIKISQIADFRKQVDLADTNSEGLCDTCVASYKAVIVENRILARRISEQNYEMSKVIARNDSILSKK